MLMYLGSAKNVSVGSQFSSAVFMSFQEANFKTVCSAASHIAKFCTLRKGVIFYLTIMNNFIRRKIKL